MFPDDWTKKTPTDYPFNEMIKSDDRATTMEIIAALGGYSVGSGMLSKEDSIIQGLVGIKMKEENPLTIGYITRIRNDYIIEDGTQTRINPLNPRTE